MKKIECIIRPEKLKGLTDALLLKGIGGLTATEVKGFGREATRPENYLFLPKTKIEIYVSDAQLDEIIEQIVRFCKEDKLGAGKIVVVPMDECIRIRTSERADQAIL